MKNISENREGKFEQAWKDAFDGKEMSPSPGLWQNLDRHLANQESKKYRKGIFIYKWVAAASIAIALAVSSIYFYSTFTGRAPQAGKVETENKGTAGSKTGTRQPGDQPVVAATQPIASGKQPGGSAKDNTNPKAHNPAGQDDRGHNQAITQLSDVKETGSHAFRNFAVTEDRDGKNNHSEHVSLLAGKGAERQPTEPQVDHLTIQKVINYGDDPFMKKEDYTVYEENLWAGINVSSGYFDPNFESGGADAMLTANEFLASSSMLADNNSVGPGSVAQDNSGGQSFAFGFSVGKRIAKKWVLQSGINYLNYSSDGSTNAFYELDDNTRTPASNLFSFSNAESLNLASSVINFDNQFEFLSIPVKAGYVLLDKKVSVVLSAGVGTDFFLENSVSPDADGLEEFNVKPGEDAPYRSVYFNGLMGTQLRYRFSKHYSFTFEPSYSIAINSFSKSDNDLNSFPNVFRIGVGLKYHFK